MKKSQFDYKLYYRRNLPHIQPVDAVFFITYCLQFDLPDDFIKAASLRKKEFNDNIKTLSEKEVGGKKYSFNKKQFIIWDDFIANYNNTSEWLTKPEIAALIIESLKYRDREEYELICYCIMPNHVHILIKPNQKSDDKPFSLARIMKNHKSYTAVKANKILNRKGQFWQRDYYDHYIRNEKEFYNVIRYILDNSVRAGFVDDYKDWKYSWVDEECIKL